MAEIFGIVTHIAAALENKLVRRRAAETASKNAAAAANRSLELKLFIDGDLAVGLGFLMRVDLDHRHFRGPRQNQRSGFSARCLDVEPPRVIRVCVNDVEIAICVGSVGNNRSTCRLVSAYRSANYNSRRAHSRDRKRTNRVRSPR